MLRRWIPGLIAVVVVLLAVESASAQRLLQRLRARREARNEVQTVQPVQSQQPASVEAQPQQATPVTVTTYERRGLFGRRRVPVQTTSMSTTSSTTQAQATTSQPTETVVRYERRGLFGRRSVPVTQTVSRSSSSTTTQQQPQAQETQQPAVTAQRQSTPTTVSQGTTTYYERRGLFGRRRVPVQTTASVGSTTGQSGSEPATRRSYYLEPNSSSVLLNVMVPVNAEVLIDGQRTNQVGASRQFRSPPLATGYEYTYTVEARWQENGQQQTRTKKVVVQPGKEVSVDLTQPDQQ
jgi:uncharacterized protein (TIGR03000 family)